MSPPKFAGGNHLPSECVFNKFQQFSLNVYESGEPLSIHGGAKIGIGWGGTPAYCTQRGHVQCSVSSQEECSPPAQGPMVRESNSFLVASGGTVALGKKRPVHGLRAASKVMRGTVSASYSVISSCRVRLCRVWLNTFYCTIGAAVSSAQNHTSASVPRIRTSPWQLTRFLVDS